MSTKLIFESENITIAPSGVTVIDWIDVRNYENFILTIENLNVFYIADILVDSSVDGGATIVLSAYRPARHDVPGYYSGKFDFELNVNYIRVRVLSDVGVQTTAKATLFAGEQTGYLCTLADIKNRLTITDTSHDAQLNGIITSVSSWFDSYCKRTLLNTGDITEYYSEESSFLHLNRWPVIDITSIKIALDYNFDSASALTANSDYRLMHSGHSGQVKHIYSRWSGENYPDCVEVIYKGGFCAAGETPSTGEFVLPADIREAAIVQSSFIFQKRDAVGVKATSFNGGSMDSFSPMELLPMVKDILNKYRRPQL